MSRPVVGRLGALAAAAVVVTASCAPGAGSGDGTAPSPPVTALEVPSTTSPTSTAPTAAPEDALRTIEVELAGGNVVGGPRRESVDRGEQVRIRARSDVAEELHVHTYDVRAEVRPGEAAEVVFVAGIPGRHEVEFEKSRKVALTLEVR